MDKKKLYLSFISVSIALFAFVIASLAWFAVSLEVEQQPIGLDVSPGIFTDYELRFFTQEDIFRLSDTYNHYVPDSIVIEKYDSSTSSWIIPAYDTSYEVGSFDGVLMKTYDPLIPANNLYNNLIIEIYFEYSVAEPSTVHVKALVDTALSGTLPDDLNDTDPHYLSQAVDVQHTSFDGITTYAMGADIEGVTRTETTNLYEVLTDLFSDDGTYSKTDFGVPTSDIDFGTMSLSGSGSRYIYFNFSYNDTNIINLVTARVSAVEGNTYYYDENDDIYLFVYNDSDTLEYTYVPASDHYTKDSDIYTIDGSGNLIDSGSVIIIPAENLYADETTAHYYTYVMRFYQDIKLSFNW